MIIVRSAVKQCNRGSTKKRIVSGRFIINVFIYITYIIIVHVRVLALYYCPHRYFYKILYFYLESKNFLHFLIAI